MNERYHQNGLPAALSASLLEELLMPLVARHRGLRTVGTRFPDFDRFPNRSNKKSEQVIRRFNASCYRAICIEKALGNHPLPR